MLRRRSHCCRSHCCRSHCCAAAPIDSASQQFTILLCTHDRQSHSATLAPALCGPSASCRSWRADLCSHDLRSAATLGVPPRTRSHRRCSPGRSLLCSTLPDRGRGNHCAFTTGEPRGLRRCAPARWGAPHRLARSPRGTHARARRAVTRSCNSSCLLLDHLPSLLVGNLDSCSGRQRTRADQRRAVPHSLGARNSGHGPQAHRWSLKRDSGDLATESASRHREARPRGVLLGERSEAAAGAPQRAGAQRRRPRGSPVVKAQKSPRPRSGRVLQRRERPGEAAPMRSGSEEEPRAWQPSGGRASTTPRAGIRCRAEVARAPLHAPDPLPSGAEEESVAAARRSREHHSTRRDPLLSGSEEESVAAARSWREHHSAHREPRARALCRDEERPPPG